MSLMCPRCDEKLACVDTRRQPVGTVKRAYRCAKCGGRVYSIEVMTKFKDAKRVEPSTDDKTLRAKRRAQLAAEVLQSQGIDV